MKPDATFALQLKKIKTVPNFLLTPSIVIHSTAISLPFVGFGSVFSRVSKNL